MWNLPGPGVELVSPAMAGEVLTISPLGKASFFFLTWPPYHLITSKYCIYFDP